MQSKICASCRQLLTLSEFYKKKDGYLGRRSSCKTCMNNKAKEYYEKNKGKIAQVYLEKRDEKIAYQKAYYRKNKKVILEQQRLRRYSND